MSSHNFVDMTNQKCGKLTVMERVANDKRGNAKWLCICDCGGIKEVLGDSLRKGNTKSCGCLTSPKNKYKVLKNYIIGYTSKGEEFYFDLEDYEKVKKYTWYINSQGYVVSRNARMQRLLMNPPKNRVVDHINRKRNDNKKSNLRVCTQQKNCLNTSTRKDNTSGCKGVYYDKRRDRWCSEIVFEKQKVFIGSFKDKNDAIAARKKSEKEYFKEYAMKGDN